MKAMRKRVARINDAINTKAEQRDERKRRIQVVRLGLINKI